MLHDKILTSFPCPIEMQKAGEAQGYQILMLIICLYNDLIIIIINHNGNQLH